ncbi:phosphofructokinase [Trinickia dabaoshanensis]|uniref:Phosphofructokinase n=1 Tax=Trinickia dabaoshanensis TaxID=564714 RepID=A0A2N7VHM3_9BURK|nr:1-phosphofructokinase family hexose kinase [Trinickia dabaoshanensis]PMS16648.1 phosphofructokinase [Trinickia dabaoshanensis]
MTRIVTLTLNPAVDLSFSVDRLVPTRKLRCSGVRRDPGGGGINVARVLRRLGADCTALYLAGGRAGRALAELLNMERVAIDCVPIAQETRENFAVRETSTGHEYRFVAPGPQVTPMEAQGCFDRWMAFDPAPHFLVVSGSLPPGVPVDFYARIARAARAKGTRVVLDTSGDALAAALDEGVYAVKPSIDELRELTGRPLEAQAEWIEQAQRLVTRGHARIVLLTLGERGALMATEDGIDHVGGVQVPVVSAVGAGDSFVAAFVWAIDRGLPAKEALRYGVAAGTSAVLRAGTVLAQPDEIERYYRASVSADAVRTS